MERHLPEQGFTKHANEALKEQDGSAKTVLSAGGFDFLKSEFGLARDRMATLATTVGTTGSFLLVLVALLVTFATASEKESDELVAASEKATLLAQRCSEDAPTAECTDRKLQQAQDAVRREREQVGDLRDLNVAQALTGAAALVGFLLSLGAHLTNPVAGPRAMVTPDAGQTDKRVAAWIAAVDRLKWKRRWIVWSFTAQMVGAGAIVYLAYEVFT
jgi:hypothetical protein